MTRRDPDEYEDTPRPIVAIGNDYPPAFELRLHQHRRGQLLYAASGVVAVSTPQGAWVAPPERAVWIPGATPHAVRMVGAVSTRSVLIEPSAVASLGQVCRVVGVSALLRALLVAAADLPLEYDEEGRDGLVMALLVAEIARAPIIPLAVPFPTNPPLAARCHRFLERPQACETIDAWADDLGMNRRRFTRLFRRETGMSFAEWRQQACLSVALPRLAAGEPVTMIALDLGYESPANFSTMFKRVLGMPPSRYRP
ncbi:helix-turn-helix domain-containing protein [Caulobacter sp. S45]|jgi:AraC-like DNA-binding protein|uniref:AraC family transcriptional regulator n=1 Tax=Caulobacter sp. S45 TaxID=1641861 RepID=UPI00131CBFCF|nr:helix-turn-helix transcriptional regulator [Caulobacter sp. S45]